MKGGTEAALIALSIFFSFDIFLLSMFFFGYYAIRRKSLRRKERSSKVSGMFVYICIGISVISFLAMRYTII
jgi:hypothetical protein